MFSPQFVNCYSALFYIAFWLKDMDRLRGMLMSLLVTKQILNNAIEMSAPYQAKAIAFVMAKIGMSKVSCALLVLPDFSTCTRAPG